MAVFTIFFGSSQFLFFLGSSFFLLLLLLPFPFLSLFFPHFEDFIRNSFHIHVRLRVEGDEFLHLADISVALVACGLLLGSLSCLWILRVCQLQVSGVEDELWKLISVELVWVVRAHIKSSETQTANVSHAVR